MDNRYEIIDNRGCVVLVTRKYEVAKDIAIEVSLYEHKAYILNNNKSIEFIDGLEVYNDTRISC